MKKFLLSLAATAAVLGFSIQAQAADKLKVCFLYVGSKTDGGWTQAHDIGRQLLEKEMGDKIETQYLENVPEGPDAERAIERFARSGCGLVFTTSFGFMDATVKVAAKFPKVKFEHATGYKTAPNLTAYNSRFYEGRYILGQIAAKTSKKGEAAYIASFPIPEVVQGINAFVIGARSINPAFKLKVIWVNTWFDAGKEADAAKAAIDQGVDIITQHTDSTAPMQVAEERGIKAFGQASDMIKAGPNAQLTAIVDNWGAYYVKRVNAALDGSWKSEMSWDGLKDGILYMAPYTNMPDDVKKMAEDTEAKIKSGELKPFTGPLKKQDGAEWLKAGESAGDDVLGGLNFYVEGVEGDLPK
ncbi:BMP family ABC transporter substrate-binding protein [Rhizobium sp. TRM95796]|uniref:BMP family ABC transporter substrate-binding protein n=1 Tax=Rhizobium sp. TRM95796 TaxID=2979862 RepID=UPI0021E8EB63|nr:BMP family ABC transporter substrate-binding protein [Rhizobium sp. TRM95796]MCV3764108.1 BMP family ABC transporter substrate-binding protein [Rhizobium sp. TRM95796]